MNETLKKIVLNNLKQYKDLSDTEMRALIFYICTYHPDCANIILKNKGISKLNVKHLYKMIEQFDENTKKEKTIKRI